MSIALKWDLSGDDDRIAFRRNGFLLKEVLDRTEAVSLAELALCTANHDDLPPRVVRLSLAEDAATRLVNAENAGGVYKVLNLPLVADRWFDLILHPGLLTIVTNLIGPDVDFVMGALICRLSGVILQGETWHTDFSTDRLSSPDLVTAILFLDDMDPNSGATEVAPGTHLTVRADGILEEGDIPNPNSIFVSSGPAGTALFIDGHLVHRVGVNRTRLHKSMVLLEFRGSRAKEVVPIDAALSGMPVARGGKFLGWR